MVRSSLALGVLVLKKIALVLALVLTAAAAFAVHEIGFSNIVGMLRYDRRREGSLHVGDRAPDVRLHALVNDSDARGDVREMHLLDALHEKPLVLVFGSYT